MKKILIIEDEPIAAKRLAQMIHDLNIGYEVIASVEGIEQTKKHLDVHGMPDLVLLDIHLADGNGMELYEHEILTCPVIFITAYDEYAVKAFRIHAIDYLLKPVNQDDLKVAIGKIKEPASETVTTIENPEFSGKGYEQRFVIKVGNNLKMIEADEIAYSYVQNKMTFITTFQGKRFLVDHSIEKLSSMLDPAVFFRINRQFIVNLKAIREMTATTKSRVMLTVDPPCMVNTTVSTERSPKFKVWLTTAKA